MIECDCEDYKLFACGDCAACTNCNYEYYMVTDEVWYSAITAMDKFQMLCIGCLEGRLDKLLTSDDFSDAPLNYINRITGSTRLKNRLTNHAAAANF